MHQRTQHFPVHGDYYAEQYYEQGDSNIRNVDDRTNGDVLIENDLNYNNDTRLVTQDAHPQSTTNYGNLTSPLAADLLNDWPISPVKSIDSPFGPNTATQREQDTRGMFLSSSELELLENTLNDSPRNGNESVNVRRHSYPNGAYVADDDVFQSPSVVYNHSTPLDGNTKDINGNTMFTFDIQDGPSRTSTLKRYSVPNSSFRRHHQPDLVQGHFTQSQGHGDTETYLDDADEIDFENDDNFDEREIIVDEGYGNDFDLDEQGEGQTILDQGQNEYQRLQDYSSGIESPYRNLPKENQAVTNHTHTYTTPTQQILDNKVTSQGHSDVQSERIVSDDDMGGSVDSMFLGAVENRRSTCFYLYTQVYASNGHLPQHR